MKTIENGVTSELTGAIASRGLSIATNSKMFKELISGIYSDKAYAITRETFANGVDSHVAAGCPERPIVVHVPSTFEPWYSIRDFGTSMNHDMVMNLYSTLGESTKDDPNSEDSNRYVGKFGLGSKSPFAYTDSFQVTAFLDGRSRIYDVFFNAGMPQIALLSDEESDEEQGILVSFGVDPKDINDFIRAIKRTTEGLDVTPLFQGEIELYQRTVLTEGKGWKLLDRTQSGYAEARQGTVLYPLNFQAVIDCPKELQALFTQPFRFDFEIGQLDIVTSREALSYDEITSKNIIERLKAVQEEIMERVKNDIAGAETFWDFCRTYHKSMQMFPENRFGKIMADKPTFRGKKPQSEITVDTHNKRVEFDTTKDDGTTAKSVKYEFRFGRLTYCKIEGRDFDKSITFREDRDRRSNRLSLSTERNIIVVTEDMREKNRYPAARIRKLLDKLLRELPHATRHNTTLVWFRHEGDSEFAFKRMFAAFGRPTLTVMNLLDVEHSIPARQYQSGPRMPFKRLSKNGDWITPDPSEDIPTEAYWVPMRNGDVDFNDGYQFSAMFMADIKPTLVAFGAEDLPIIGIPASSRKIVANNPDWLHFIDFVRDNIQTMFDPAAYARCRVAKMNRSEPSVVKFIEYIRWEVKDTQLLADAFSAPIFKEIDGIMAQVEASEDDKRQAIICDVLKRLEDQRVGAAKRDNAAYRLELLGAGEDPDADGIVYQDEVNHVDKMREEIESNFRNESARLDELAGSVIAEFPLLGFLDTGSFRWKDEEVKVAGLTEVLNYIVNKQLVAVDTAIAA